MIGLAMAVIVLVGFSFAIQDARRSVRDEAESSVNLALGLVDSSLTDDGLNDQAVLNWVDRFGRSGKIRHLRISLLAYDGLTTVKPALQTKPEIRVPDWFHWVVSPQPRVVDRRVESKSHLPRVIRIEANVDDEIFEAWTETKVFLLLLVTLAGAIYAAVRITIGRALKSVESLLAGLEHIEKGDLGARLPPFPIAELDRLSRGFNHMASALEMAREENKSLTRHSLAIQEEERRVLARELHDEFGQCLTAIKVMLVTLQPGGAPELISHPIMGLCDRLLESVRAMMRRLRPMALDDLGLVASLDDLVAQWQTARPGLTIHLECTPDVDNLSGAIALQIYRIIQEGLTNMVKHSSSNCGWVRLAMDGGGWVNLVIEDEGQGFNPNQPACGFGLQGIRERIASLEGRFSLDSRPGRGVRLNISIPSIPTPRHE